MYTSSENSDDISDDLSSSESSSILSGDDYYSDEDISLSDAQLDKYFEEIMQNRRSANQPLYEEPDYRRYLIDCALENYNDEMAYNLFFQSYEDDSGDKSPLYGKEIRFNALAYAVREEKFDFFRRLISYASNKANEDTSFDGELTSSALVDKQNIIHVICELESYQMLNIIDESDFSDQQKKEACHEVDYRGWTPAVYLIRQNNPQMLSVIARRIDPNQKAQSVLPDVDLNHYQEMETLLLEPLENYQFMDPALRRDQIGDLIKLGIEGEIAGEGEALLHIASKEGSYEVLLEILKIPKLDLSLRDDVEGKRAITHVLHTFKEDRAKYSDFIDIKSKLIDEFQGGKSSREVTKYASNKLSLYSKEDLEFLLWCCEQGLFGKLLIDRIFDFELSPERKSEPLSAEKLKAIIRELLYIEKHLRRFDDDWQRFQNSNVVNDFFHSKGTTFQRFKKLTENCGDDFWMNQVRDFIIECLTKILPNQKNAWLKKEVINRANRMLESQFYMPLLKSNIIEFITKQLIKLARKIGRRWFTDKLISAICESFNEFLMQKRNIQFLDSAEKLSETVGSIKASLENNVKEVIETPWLTENTIKNIFETIKANPTNAESELYNDDLDGAYPWKSEQQPPIQKFPQGNKITEKMKNYFILEAAQKAFKDEELSDGEDLDDEIEEQRNRKVKSRWEKASISNKLGNGDKVRTDYILIFRGINFNRNLFTYEERSEYVLTKSKKMKSFFSMACYHLIDKKIYDNSANATEMQEKAEEIRELFKKFSEDDGKEIFKTDDEYKLMRDCKTFRHLIQKKYSEDLSGFDDVIARICSGKDAERIKRFCPDLEERIRKRIVEKYPNFTGIFTRNCCVSGGYLPEHAIRYTLGMSRSQPAREKILNPRYKKNGKPKYPCVGVVFIALLTKEDYEQRMATGLLTNLPLEMKSGNVGKLASGKTLMPETEITFPGAMDNIVLALPLVFPDLSDKEDLKRFDINNPEVILELMSDGGRRKHKTQLDNLFYDKIIAYYRSKLQVVAENLAIQRDGRLILPMPDNSYRAVSRRVNWPVPNDITKQVFLGIRSTNGSQKRKNVSKAPHAKRIKITEPVQKGSSCLIDNEEMILAVTQPVVEIQDLSSSSSGLKDQILMQEKPRNKVGDKSRKQSAQLHNLPAVNLVSQGFFAPKKVPPKHSVPASTKVAIVNHKRKSPQF